jgi:hypothetical protein
MNEIMDQPSKDNADVTCCWRSNEIYFPCCIGFDADGNDIVEERNLADYIGSDCNRPGETLLIARNATWDNGLDAACRRRLNDAMFRACRKHAGFKAICLGWKADQLKIPYACHRYKAYKSQSKVTHESKQRKTTTTKAMEEENRCTFHFHVNWYIAPQPGDDDYVDHPSVKYSRWILVAGNGRNTSIGNKANGCAQHCQHLKMTFPEENSNASDSLVQASAASSSSTQVQSPQAIPDEYWKSTESVYDQALPMFLEMCQLAEYDAETTRIFQNGLQELRTLVSNHVAKNMASKVKRKRGNC